jgi:hypothetical protein
MLVFAGGSRSLASCAEICMHEGSRANAFGPRYEGSSCRLEDVIRSGINLEHSQRFVDACQKRPPSGLVRTRGGEEDPEARLKRG